MGEQFYANACREYTLPRSDGSSQHKNWTRAGSYDQLVSCLYGKHGVEIRIWSLSEDNTHSWVNISHGSNKFVMDSNNNGTEVPEDQPEEQALQLNAKDFACRSKAKAKPQRREPADTLGLLLSLSGSLMSASSLCSPGGWSAPTLNSAERDGDSVSNIVTRA